MLIRSATLTDLHAVVDLFEQYRIFYRKAPDRERATAFIQERLTQGDSVIYVADQDGELVGFTQLYPMFSSTRMQRQWLLNDLFVAPAQRGNGYGLALIDRAKQLASDTAAAGLILETELTNDIGNQLYPRAGFTLNTSTHFYFWDVS